MESNYENKIQLFKKSCSGAFWPNFFDMFDITKKLGKYYI